MRSRGLIIGVALVMLVVLSFATVQIVASTRPIAMDDYKGHPASPLPTPGTRGTSAPSGVSATPDTASSANTSDEPGLSEGAGGADADTGSDRPTWDPAAEAPQGADQEAKVPGSEGTESYRLPPAPERKPALTSVPKPAAAEGKLTVGFPEQVIPAPEDADVQSSSVAPQGRRVLVGLDTLTGQQPEEVLDFYAGHCDELGWPVERGSAPDGASQVRCGFAPDSLTVTTRTLPTGRTAVTAAGAFEVSQVAAGD